MTSFLNPCSTRRAFPALLPPPMSEDATTSSESSGRTVKRPNKRAKKNASRGDSGKSAKKTQTSREDVKAGSDKPETPPVNEETVTLPDPPSEMPTGETAQENNKRNKRRRRKGKGGSSTDSAAVSSGDPGPTSGGNFPAAEKRPSAASGSKADPQLVAKFAWKIFLAEVSEEGVALIGDSDARDLSRRCFRLAEIFIEEQMRRG